MTLEEALVILDIDGSADPQIARRAYLRLLKKHKPERDPEGFKKLRAAYELANQQLAWRMMLAVDEPSELTIPEPEMLLEDDDAPWVELPSEVGALYDQLEGMTDSAQRAGAIREALEAHDSSPQLLWMLYDELLGTDDDGAIAALRRGQAAGFAGFLGALLHRFPQRATDDELRGASEDTDVHTRTAAARAWIYRDDPQRAAEALSEIISALDRDPDVEGPSMHIVLDAVLEMLARGASDPGRALMGVYDHWVHQSGVEGRILGSPLAMTLAMTRELAELPHSFPPEVLGVIAAAARDGDLGDAAEALEELSQDKPYTASLARDGLNDHTDLLRQALCPALAEPVLESEPARRGAFDALPWWPLLLFGLIFSHMMRDCGPG